MQRFSTKVAYVILYTIELLLTNQMVPSVRKSTHSVTLVVASEYGFQLSPSQVVYHKLKS